MLTTLHKPVRPASGRPMAPRPAIATVSILCLSAESFGKDCHRGGGVARLTTPALQRRKREVKTMITRRTTLISGAAALAAPAILRRAWAAATPGVTATEIKIGNTMPYSGPASSYSVIGRTETAFFNMVNDQGGVAGRKINFISLDDGYSPPKTVEEVRRLVEQDQVDFLLPEPRHADATRRSPAYLNQKKVPQLFVGSGASKWSDYKKYPWTMGWQPNYRTEAQIYTKYMLQTVKDPKLGILYQNDDFGKDYPTGVRDALGDDWDKIVVKKHQLRDHRRDDRLRRSPSCRPPAPMCCWWRRFPNSPRSRSARSRPQLEADVLHDQRRDLGRHGDAAGRTGKIGRHAQHAVSEGSDRSDLERTIPA